MLLLEAHKKAIPISPNWTTFPGGDLDDEDSLCLSAAARGCAGLVGKSPRSPGTQFAGQNWQTRWSFPFISIPKFFNSRLSPNKLDNYGFEAVVSNRRIITGTRRKFPREKEGGLKAARNALLKHMVV